MKRVVGSLRRLLSGMSWCCAMLCCGIVAAHASGFPTQPITLVVPFPAGGGSDHIARIIAPRLEAELGKPVVIEHMAGGTGTAGALHLKKAPADGHTLMVASVGLLVTHPLVDDVPYDPLEDFEILTVAVRAPNMLAVHPSVPVKDVGELIAHLKKSGGKMLFATSGAGSSDHLATELFWQRTGTSGVPVHHKGAGPGKTSLLRGETAAGLINFQLAIPYVQNGQLRGLAISGAQRNPSLPHMPTFRELGVDGVEVYSWQGIVAPHGLPSQVKLTLHRALINALQAPAVQERLHEQGLEVPAFSPAEAERFLREDIARWQAVIRTAGLKQ